MIHAPIPPSLIITAPITIDPITAVLTFLAVLAVLTFFTFLACRCCTTYRIKYNYRKLVKLLCRIGFLAGSIPHYFVNKCKYICCKYVKILRNWRKFRYFLFWANSILWSIFNWKCPARRTVTAEFLQRICTTLSPSLISQSDMSNRAQLLKTYLKNGRDTRDGQDNIINFTCPIQLKKIEKLIRKSHLTQHIKFSHELTESNNAPYIEFRNLNIKGDFDGDFHSFVHVSLINNIFHNNVKIHIIGARYSKDSIMHNNKFFGNFRYDVFNVPNAYFKKNKGLKLFTVIRRLKFKDWKECLTKFMHPLEKPQLHPTNIMLTDNHINICGICAQRDFSDKNGTRFHRGNTIELIFTGNHITTCRIWDWSTTSTDTHINNIRFQGGNVLNRLAMRTKYTVLRDVENKATIGKISFDANDEIIPFENEKKSTLHSYVNYFTELHENSLTKKHNLSTANYARQVKRIDFMLMSRWQDKSVIYWGELISNGGTSWVKALGWLLLLQFTLALIAYHLFAGHGLHLNKECTMLSNMSCNIYIKGGWGAPFWALVAWFMNPASFLPSIPITMNSWPIYFLFFFQKLFSAVFYYEIIKVLRRFTK